MGSGHVNVGAKVESVGNYYSQVKVYKQKCDNASYGNPYGTLPNGSLAWPGDPELLESYGVRVEEISEEFAKIIQCINDQEQENLLRPDLENKNSTSCLIDNYDVVKTILPQKEKKCCKYCHEDITHDATYQITEVESRKTVTLTDYRWHLIKQHGDLGNRKKNRIHPELFCKVLGLGQTHLPEEDPLFRVANSYHMEFKQLERQLIKEGILIRVPHPDATLMMHASSGRGGPTDDDDY